MRVTIMGRGRVGRGLAKALDGSAIESTLTSGRRPRAAAFHNVDVIVLAIPDSAYADVARAIVDRIEVGSVVLHCSGSLGVCVLESCREACAHIGAMHPLVSFATKPPELRGTSFIVDGDPEAIRAARRIAKAVGARVVAAPLHGPTYHAAAALTANGAAALANVAVGLVERLGVDRRSAERAIGALLRSVGDNVEKVGVPDALSGPIMRGDANTVKRHRTALEESPTALAAYDAVAPLILTCARAIGLPDSRAKAVRRALAKRSSRR